ncbi:MAG: NAD-dependent succinate-semialdehyde dehydrogenase [Acidimicrobiales bacterium]|nr:NAD-dependent succinate-semialdehyde dehydrogenase [Acidimicrobiales bacterium]
MSSPDSFTSINPADGSALETYPAHDQSTVDRFIDEAAQAQRSWAARPYAERAEIMMRAAEVLKSRTDELAELMTREMGKPIGGARGEVTKCAWVCEYYAEEAEGFMADVARPSDHAGAWTVYEPLGVILAVMPWNFPLWQVFRFAAPTLMAGNTGLLKHASNVSGSALAIENVFTEAGLPEGVFRTLLIGSDRVEGIIADPRIAAVTLTGSEAAGRAVGGAAGRNLKPSVLELGGSDAYVVLDDADIDNAVSKCAAARLMNSGQSCIAAKRFIVTAGIYDEFVARFVDELASYRIGDPMADDTDVGPQARLDLRDDLHQQVQDSIAAGATLLLGGEVPEGPGAFYPVTALENVAPGMPAFDDELFGPVAAIIRADDEDHAIELANNTEFGLGGAVFTADVDRGREIAAHRIVTGNCFVNTACASDPRLPFGGIGISGYGRELSEMGIHAFVNAKTVAVAAEG